MLIKRSLPVSRLPTINSPRAFWIAVGFLHRGGILSADGHTHARTHTHTRTQASTDTYARVKAQPPVVHMFSYVSRFYSMAQDNMGRVYVCVCGGGIAIFKGDYTGGGAICCVCV